MKKLELKHLAAYLPYGFTFKSEMDKPFDEVGINPIWTAEGIIKMFGDYCLTTKDNNDAYAIQTCKPLLRPLSQLTQEIEHNREKFVPIEKLRQWFTSVIFQIGNDHKLMIKGKNECFISNDYFFLISQHLLEWHFDIYGLLENNLAIEKL
jgi:hypothetical protein